LVLRAIGWRPAGEPPELPRYVLIAAPHTTNWDLPVMLAFGLYYGLRIQWFGKHTLFAPPFGGLMRAVGGIPIDRRARHDMVKQAADALRAAPSMVLAVPPEGTRKRTEYWKSGFYWIAHEAGVPIVCGFLDYGRREGGFGPTVWTTGVPAADMATIRAFYREKIGLYPENFGPVRLRDEG
jgi:1-acyl-sn-glycerol-3-phosphate acyltransferase